MSQYIAYAMFINKADDDIFHKFETFTESKQYLDLCHDIHPGAFVESFVFELDMCDLIVRGWAIGEEGQVTPSQHYVGEDIELI